MENIGGGDATIVNQIPDKGISPEEHHDEGPLFAPDEACLSGTTSAVCEYRFIVTIENCDFCIPNDFAGRGLFVARPFLAVLFHGPRITSQPFAFSPLSPNNKH
jgi:hypothetical protein